MLLISCNPDLLPLLQSVKAWRADVRTITSAIDVDPRDCAVCGVQKQQQQTSGSEPIAAQSQFHMVAAEQGVIARAGTDGSAPLQDEDLATKGECRLCAARKRVRRTFFVYDVHKE